MLDPDRCYVSIDEMVRAEVPLVEIAQVLRHKSLQSSAIYARVDLYTLHRLAAPWPGGRR